MRDTDIVARLGGDEFAILQTRIEGPSDAAEMARRIVEVTAHSMISTASRSRLTGSIGITLFPADGNDADELLKNADLAMYQAKADGGRGFRFYSTDMQAQVQDIARLDSNLAERSSRKQFVLHYQPQVDAKSGRIVGAEALVRWRAPTASSSRLATSWTAPRPTA